MTLTIFHNYMLIGILTEYGIKNDRHIRLNNMIQYFIEDKNQFYIENLIYKIMNGRYIYIM